MTEPVTPEDLRAASISGPYREALMLRALAQVLERLDQIEAKLSEFECHGGRCVYD